MVFEMINIPAAIAYADKSGYTLLEDPKIITKDMISFLALDRVFTQDVMICMTYCHGEFILAASKVEV